LINRIQPLENVRRATEEARRIGFTSVNFDLIYGLPLQTLASIERTIKEVIELKPDRIAFYSYAHVPWTSRAQRLFDETHLPAAEEKIRLYLKGRELLMDAGYIDIGMDHFALPDDELNLASQDGLLHRNFMGYTTQNTGFLLGLGVSSISDIGKAYGQNHKTLHEYYESIEAGILAIKKGYLLTEEDQAFKKYIIEASCKGAVRLEPEHLLLLKTYSFPVLDGLEKDELVQYNEQGLTITPKGHYFIRNICSAFDLYLQRRQPSESKPIFSKAI
ncbi:MAG TPA: coproporphyrinogen III oxidase, partial [Flavisolibacter sp.]|nr:coproporphyrinogen III oxidase [Flavisolibacter sp.]